MDHTHRYEYATFLSIRTYKHFVCKYKQNAYSFWLIQDIFSYWRLGICPQPWYD